MLKNEKDYPLDNNFNVSFPTRISDVKISYTEKLMAVALEPNTEAMDNQNIQKITSASIALFYYLNIMII